jgi:hypothetical protein
VTRSTIAEWPGDTSIVPFIGEETVIDGEMDRKGHTRQGCAIGSILSAAVEQVALQTKRRASAH